MHRCTGCQSPFTPEPWKKGWTDTYCPRCIGDSYKQMGPTFQQACQEEIATAMRARGLDPVLPPLVETGKRRGKQTSPGPVEVGTVGTVPDATPSKISFALLAIMAVAATIHSDISGIALIALIVSSAWNLRAEWRRRHPKK